MSQYNDNNKNSKSKSTINRIPSSLTSSSSSPMKINNVYVEKPEVLEDLLNDIYYNSSSSLSYTKRNTNNNSIISVNQESSLTSTEIQKQLLREQIKNNKKTQELVTKNNIQKALQKKIEKQEERYNKLSSNIDKSLKLLDDIDKDLDLVKETHRTKIRRQFEDWNTNVHGKIQMLISKQVDNMQSKQLNAQKCKDYEKFLDITNRKPAIFRDIIIESEYDPLEPNRRAVKAKTKKLKDPTMIDQQKAESEEAMLGSDIPKKEVRRGKDTLPVHLWAAGQIEATPYGSFAKMMDNSVGGGKLTATMKSNVVFDHFNFPYGKAAIDKEMPLGKRVYPKKDYAKNPFIEEIKKADFDYLKSIDNSYLNN
jgi:hypothetical protein